MKLITTPSIGAGVAWTLTVVLSLPGPALAAQDVEVSIRDGVLEAVDASRPAEVVVYDVLPPEPQRWMDALQAVAGLEGRAEEDDGLLSVSARERYLEVRRASGGAFYGDMSRLWRGGGRPGDELPTAPSDERAREIAGAMLGRFGFGDAERADLEISVSDEVMELRPNDAAGDPRRHVVGKNVEVRRRVDGLLVHGPGSKIKLHVGPDGQVEGYTAVWRQLDPGSRVLGHRPADGGPTGPAARILSAAEAFERFRGDPLDRLTLAPVDRIDIDRVELGYFARPATEVQRHLQPVYVFSGVASTRLPDGRETRLPFTQYVLALPEPLEALWPEPAVFEGDPGPKRARGHDDVDEGR